jgi:hypothetical protein
MMLVCAAFWRSAASQPDGRLHVHILSVPDGPAVLVQTPGGDNILVNGGSSANSLGSELGKRLALFDHLDALVVTDVKSKSLAGLPVSMERFKPQTVLWNANAASLRNGRLLADVLDEQKIQPVWLESGQVLKTKDDISMRVLLHDTSGTALLLEWNRFSLLIPGGIPPEIISNLRNINLSGLDAILLSKDDLERSKADQWEQFQPVLIVWSGPDDAEVQADNPRWVHLDELSYLELTTDGKQMWAEAGEK